MANSADPNQPNDLDLHVLQRQGISWFSRFFIVLGLTTHPPLWVILCCLPEKGIEIQKRAEKMKERDWGERKMNDGEETEEIKTFPLYPYLLQG